MDPARNPFTPGAGTQPPELAGRDQIIAEARVTLQRVKAGKPAKSQLLLGLRGVGKTVLLNRLAQAAEGLGFRTVVLEAPEDRRLADLLVPPLRAVLFRLDRVKGARESARRAMGALRAFAAAFKVRAGEVEFGVEAARGTADSGDLDFDLTELLLLVGRAAHDAHEPVAVFLDEVQYLSEEDLRALIVSLHRCTQVQLPLVLFGAGLPQLAALAGDARSYAERLFDYPEVGTLAPNEAREAIREPLKREKVEIAVGALEEILRQTHGYPYFLQEWGARAWNAAAGSSITAADARRATTHALARLDQGFFRVRWDRLTPRERDYLRAMAQLGPGPHRSGDIANLLRIPVTSAAPLRGALVHKGMIYSQQHGETAFTVPLFDQFLTRTIPNWRRPAVTKAGGKKRKRRG